MQKIFLLGALIMTYTLYPEFSLAMYGKGDWVFKLEGTEKNLSKASYNINLKGREKGFYFKSFSTLGIDLDEKKPEITNTQLNIYNKSYNLQLGNFSAGISQLVEPNLSLFGVSLEHTKKSKTKTIKLMSFAGKSTTSPVVGVKINTEYGSNTSYGLFLLNKKTTSMVGLNFLRPVHRFSSFQGECYLENMNKWGLLLKELINYKKTTIQTEYSIIDNIDTFKLVSLYKTKRLKAECEYSRMNQSSLWKLKSDLKTKNFFTGGVISTKKSEAGTNTLSQENLFYSGYIGYNLKLGEKITPSISYNHSYSNQSALATKNITKGISMGLTYLESSVSISTPISLQQEKKQRQASITNELTFKRGIKLRYVYYGFKPWVSFNLTTTKNKTGISYQEKSNSISYGISKNFGRNLSFSYDCYQTEAISESLEKETIDNRITRYLSASYRFPKIPVNLNTKISWIDRNKPTSYISITYRKGDKKDTLVKYQDEKTVYTKERPIILGTLTKGIISMTKEVPTQDNLLKLGSINIMVFKDEDFDGKFGGKDIPCKEIKMKLGKIQTMTDEDGKTLFVDVPVGTYTFSIDFSELPIGLACKTKAEQTIEIKEGEDIYLNFPITQTGKISGGVFIDKNRNGIWDEEEKGAGDILLYADDNPKYTAINGKYKFTNLIPGIIKIKIDLKSLPENFEMTTKDNSEIKLSSKEEIKNINFGIAEIEPEIEFE